MSSDVNLQCQTIDEIEVTDEMEDFFSPSDNEKKWLLVHENIDPKKYNDLLHEVEYLKNMIIDMHKIMIVQNENVSRIGDNVNKMNESMIFVTSELSSMKGIKSSSKYSYVRDYLFPVLKLAGTYTPFVMIMAAKTGLSSSIICFLFSRIF